MEKKKQNSKISYDRKINPGTNSYLKDLTQRLEEKFKNSVIFFYAVFVCISFAIFILTRFLYYDEIQSQLNSILGQYQIGIQLGNLFGSIISIHSEFSLLLLYLKNSPVHSISAEDLEGNFKTRTMSSIKHLENSTQAIIDACTSFSSSMYQDQITNNATFELSYGETKKNTTLKLGITELVSSALNLQSLSLQDITLSNTDASFVYRNLLNGPTLFISRQNSKIRQDISDASDVFKNQSVNKYFVLGCLLGQLVFIAGCILAKIRHLYQDKLLKVFLVFDQADSEKFYLKLEIAKSYLNFKENGDSNQDSDVDHMAELLNLS